MAGESIVARVPLHTEHASIDKRVIGTGVVTINTSIESRIEHLTEALMREDVFIERVPIGVEITVMPPVRTEDDVVVIPVVEEKVVVSKRLVLTEELRVHRRQVREVAQLPISLRSTAVTVQRKSSAERDASVDPEVLPTTRRELMDIRTMTAIYDSEDDASAARDRLLSAGLAEDDVQIVSPRTSMADDGTERDDGLWESIKSCFVTEDDRHTYSEGMRRGGFLLTARVEEARVDDALAVLEETSPVDLAERAQQWRAEGWTDYAPSSHEGLTDAQDGESTPGEPEEQTVPVVEERLLVGKREVNRGGVRVRSYVVEEPIQDEISLREEHVEVERRPIAVREAVNPDELFQERTIEVSEIAEEAVVTKEARVTEEVVVRKITGERTQGIDETVRRTEVEVDDTRDDDAVASQPRSTLKPKRRGQGTQTPR